MAHCAKCGREVPLPEGYGVTFLCEFFYCEDQEACRAASVNQQRYGKDLEGATFIDDKGQTWRVGKQITIPTPEQK